MRSIMRSLCFVSCAMAMALPSHLAFSQVPTREVTVKWSSYLTEDNKVINGLGGTEEVLLVADGDWVLSISEDVSSWLSTSPTSGHSGKARISVTSAPNHYKTSRTGTVTVTSSGKVDTLTITQRPCIYERKVTATGKVRNHVAVDYQGTEFTQICSLIPVPQSCLYQDIFSFTGSGKILKCGNNDNLYLVSDLSSRDIPYPGGNIISSSFDVTCYSVTADLSLIDDIPEPDLTSYPYKKCLKDEKPYIVPSDPDIIAVADQQWDAAGGDLLDYARKCYLWTVENMVYGNPYTDLHSIKELMRTRTGDCGNYCSVFISLLRAKGIPARHVVMIEPERSGKHVRAEFYIPGYGWIPADPQQESRNPYWDRTQLFFGRFSGKYVVLSMGINSQVRMPDNQNHYVPLLQTYKCWYRYEKLGRFSFRHEFSGLE